MIGQKTALTSRPGAVMSRKGDGAPARQGRSREERWRDERWRDAPPDYEEMVDCFGVVRSNLTVRVQHGSVIPNRGLRGVACLLPPCLHRRFSGCVWVWLTPAGVRWLCWAFWQTSGAGLVIGQKNNRPHSTSWCSDDPER